MTQAPEPSTPAPPPPATVIHDRPLNKRWLAEGVLVLASVLIGFAVSEFGQYRDERGLADSVLRGIRAEIEQNESQLARLESQHRLWQTGMAQADRRSGNRSAIEILIDSRPAADATIGVPLKRAAWQMAISSGALRLLDYQVAAAVSEIYTFQDLMTESHTRMVNGILYTAAAFERAPSEASLLMLRGMMSEIAGNEKGLLDLYRKHLPLLARAADD